MKSLSAFWDFSRFSVHGDTQAVFEFEPPESVLKDISTAENADGNVASEDASLRGAASAKPQLKRTNTKRKDSMAAITGFTEHLSEFLHERGAENIGDRLEAVEAATKRIEKMLIKLSQDMGEDNSESGGGLHASNSEAVEEGED